MTRYISTLGGLIAVFFLLLFSHHANAAGNYASFMASTPAASPGACSPASLGNLQCDVNGWTVFQVSVSGFCEGTGTWTVSGSGCTGAPTNVTAIYYVSTATASPAGSDSNAGTITAPFATPRKCLLLTRAGSPDWCLLRKGQVWTDQALGNLQWGGMDINNPILISSYDASLPVTHPPIPNPQTATARPEMDTSSVWAGTQVSAFATVGGQCTGCVNYVALAGLKFYAFTRDPANTGSFTLAEAQVNMSGVPIENTTNGVLIEDCWVGFYISDIGTSGTTTYATIQNTFYRRNEILSSYGTPGTPETSGFNMFQIQGGTAAGYNISGNVIDHGGWNTDGGITWANPSGFNHNIYLQYLVVNGDIASLSIPATFTDNSVSNEAAGAQFRSGGNFDDNFYSLSDVPYSGAFPTVFANKITNNIFTGNLASTVGGAGMISLIGTNFEISPFPGAATIQGNLLVNNVVTPGGSGITLNGGVNGASVVGNVIYNTAASNTSQALTSIVGGINTYTITNPGSGYTDNKQTISAAQSSSTPFLQGGTFGFNWGGDAQGYIIVTVPNATDIALIGTAIYQVGIGALSSLVHAAALCFGTIATITPITGTTGHGIANGTYTDIPFFGPTDATTNRSAIASGTVVVSGGTPTVTSVTLTGGGQNNFVGQTLVVTPGQLGCTVACSGTINIATTATLAQNDKVILYGTSFGSTFTGTLYYPWYNVNLTHGSGIGTGAQLDLISAGGQIVGSFLGGADQFKSSTANSLGQNYTGTDTGLSATTGTACGNNFTCGSGFSPSGGSNLAISVNTISVNTGVTSIGCTLASQNDSDPTGVNTNGCTRTAPNRTAGSYVACLENSGSDCSPFSVSGVTANATFTGVIASHSCAPNCSVLTVTSMTGTLNLGDAITWSGQTSAAQDYIKFDSTSGSTACNGSSCTGTAGSSTGAGPFTFGLAGTESQTSIAMSSWTAQQLVNLQRNQSKASWNKGLTACNVNNYFRAGFGVAAVTCPAGG